MNKEIKAIIFDYGGVLSRETRLNYFGEIYASKHGKSAEDFKKLMRENWHLARINKISSQDFWRKLASFLEVHPPDLRRDLMKFFGFNKELFEFVKKLKRKGYKIGLLSNQIEDWLEEVIENHGLNQIFDAIVTSYKSKVAKPDILLFKEITEKLNLNAAQCIYIDDMEKNIPPAKKLGMKTILFKNNKQLITDLKKLGIKA